MRRVPFSIKSACVALLLAAAMPGASLAQTEPTPTPTPTPTPERDGKRGYATIVPPAEPVKLEGARLMVTLECRDGDGCQQTKYRVAPLSIKGKDGKRRPSWNRYFVQFRAQLRGPQPWFLSKAAAVRQAARQTSDRVVTLKLTRTDSPVSATNPVIRLRVKA